MTLEAVIPEEEEHLNNCNARKKDVNVNNNAHHGMEEWFVKTPLHFAHMWTPQGLLRAGRRSGPSMHVLS